MRAEMIRWLERCVLIPISVMAIIRFAPSIWEHPASLILLASELVAVMMILLQRRGEWAVEIYPVAVAVIGTSFALLASPTGEPVIDPAIANAIMMAGAMVSLSAKVFLGRSFGLVAANRGVKFQGIYRLIRHPMYAGYILTHTGFLLSFMSTRNLVVFAVAWTALWLRIVEEEKFLNRDPEYRAYAARVRYRLFPGIA